MWDRAPVLLPLHIQMDGLPVLVVGAGPVGRRRRQTLLDAGAIVRWVAPDSPEVAAPFSEHHLDGQRLVFACATPAVNQAVTDAARARGVWVCRADAPGDLELPAVRRSGDITASLTTGVPAATRVLADALAQQLETWEPLLQQLAQVRDAHPPGPERQALLKRLAAELMNPSQGDPEC